MVRDRRTLYLLVEESDREFLARCLIGVLAVAEGFDVVIGPQWWIWDNLDALAPGTMLFKGNNTVQAVNMRRARQAGHAIASIEEEALGVIDEAEIVRLYDPDIAAVCDLLLVQGRFQAVCLERRFPGSADRISVVGNPRIDLLRPPFDRDLRRSAAALRDRIGSYVLLNTNFGSINPAHGDALTYYNRCLSAGILDPDNPADLDDFFTWCRWERDNARCLIDFARGLAAVAPTTRIILRPHPSESLSRWRDCLGPSSGVEIIRQGAHLPWTIGSSVMVHTGCTTGLEAAVLGAPALSLTPGDNRWHAISTSNVANPTAATAKDAVARVAAHLSGERSGLGAEMAAIDYSDYLDVSTEALSARRVVDSLATLHGAGRFKRGAGGPVGMKSMSAWQRQKYAATLEEAKSAIAGYSDAIEQATTVTVRGLADTAILLRAA